MNKIVVLGAGESGVGAALLGKKIGAEVWVSDAGKIQEKYRNILTENEIPFEEGKHTIESFFDANVIIKSPGIPSKVPVIQALKEAGKEIISEIEFASRHTDTPIIAITGSNGKTTTTAWIHHLLVTGGINAALGGNIGKSFAGLVAEDIDCEVFVLEISSFQLDDIVHFRPDIAVLTNITADHLDRYDYSMEKYAAAKFRIAMNQRPEDAFVYYPADMVTQGELWKHSVKASRLGFALEQRPDVLIWVKENQMVAGYKFELPIAELGLKGPHNVLNAMAATLVAKRMKVSDEAIIKGLKDFQAIEHRMEPVATINDVLYINDSKATNIDSVIYSLKSVEGPIVWIAGGLDKGNDYSLLDTSAVKALVILGPNKDKLKATYQDQMMISEAENMAQAIEQATAFATAGDTVLLAPACSSFDIFQNFEDRGRQFKAEVLKMRK
jgi:UDP-N-acetylmuramoylalanine--D-glutamate ligase